jgi:hypothetical protein
MSTLSNNIRLSYLYRDAGNYKLFGQVVFGNPENIALEEIRNRINDCLIDGEFFEAKKWGLPELKFENYLPELDHNWCEFENVEVSFLDITDNRAIVEFICEIEGFNLKLHSI